MQHLRPHHLQLNRTHLPKLRRQIRHQTIHQRILQPIRRSLRQLLNYRLRPLLREITKVIAHILIENVIINQFNIGKAIAFQQIVNVILPQRQNYPYIRYGKTFAQKII